jgi:hypothetical protein
MMMMMFDKLHHDSGLKSVTIQPERRKYKMKSIRKINDDDVY